MQALNCMDPVAADAAKYLADRLIESRAQEFSPDVMREFAYDSLMRAIRDSTGDEIATPEEVARLASVHGNDIATMAIAMAYFLAQPRRKGWIAGTVAAGLGLAVAALIG